MPATPMPKIHKAIPYPSTHTFTLACDPHIGRVPRNERGGTEQQAVAAVQAVKGAAERYALKAQGHAGRLCSPLLFLAWHAL